MESLRHTYWKQFDDLNNDIRKGSKCTSSKFANEMKLSDAMDTPEGWETIQKGMVKLKEWVHENHMSFNKTKSKVLLLGRGNPQFHHRLWDKQILLRKTWEYRWMRGWT